MPKKDSRGFQTFTDFHCTYGTEVRVKESSAAGNGPRIWVFMEEDHTILTKPELGAASAHLTFAQAKKLVKALETAMKNHYQVKL
jgi:hypothetical protein